MGFNKLHLPDVDYLEKQLSEMGRISFGEYWLNRYQRTDATIGSTESFDFIKPFADSAYNNKEIFVDDENMASIKE
ncbi:hypothetical protein OAE73_00400 [bacterium]|nr:hypothetical protein [bacterium]